MTKTITELDKIKKMKEMIEIYNSSVGTYEKAFSMCQKYNSRKKFREVYLALDECELDNPMIQEYLQAFKEAYRFYSKCDKSGIVSSVNDIINNEVYFENYPYARFVVGKYVNDKKSPNMKVFLDNLGIDQSIFEFCLDTLKEVDVDLYRKYLSVADRNHKNKIIKDIATVKDLANGMTTGVLSDGTPFDLLEFWKRVPFRHTKNFIDNLSEFTKRNMPRAYSTIFNYIIDNYLYGPTYMLPVDRVSLKSSTTTLKNRRLTDKQKEDIFQYMEQNDLPMIQGVYNLVRNKYLNGEIQVNVLSQEESKCKKKVLIP